MKKNNMKAQVWITDFVIAILIFSLVFVLYYRYTTNLSRRDSVLFDEILSDAETVSSFLTSPGYPEDWTGDNVIRIGFTDEYNRINTEKFNEFIKMDSNKTKKLLGTMHDYVLFFLNASGEVQNIEGYCGYGECQASITYKEKAAYYYQGGSGDDQFLRQFMSDMFDVDIYTESGTGLTEEGDPVVIEGDLCDLTNKIANDDYWIVVVEAPEMPSGNPCGKFKAFKNAVEPWVFAGGMLMISGELVAGQKKEMVGVAFEKDAGLSSPQEHATVVNEDDYLDFELTGGLMFDQGFTVEDIGVAPPAEDFKDIARFNESDIEFADILDNKIAVARWQYGDGKVFFFSDYRAEYFAGNFIDTLKDATLKWAEGECAPIDISSEDLENLARIERLVVYNSEIMKMVIYACDK